MTLFQRSFDEDAKDHWGSNVTLDSFSNYMYVIGSCACMHVSCIVVLICCHCVVDRERDPRYIIILI